MNDEWEEVFHEVYGLFIVPERIEAQKETLKQRAADAHPILIERAECGNPGDEEEPTRKRPTIEYGKLAQQIESNSSYIWNVLVALDKIGAKRGDPPVSPLVESSRTVGPGHGYFEWDHLPGPTINTLDDGSGLQDEQKEAWRRKLREVYAHDDWYWSL